MKRREFLKSMGLFGTTVAMPSLLWNQSVRAALPDGINYLAPAIMPQVVNIFLYGGPSELAGNLTNITEINANSQNPYPSYLDPADANSGVTPNGFWGPDSNGNNSAGGDIMETLIADGDMSIYRTINRVADDNKGHGRSVTQNLVGNLLTTNPGIGTTLTAILAQHNPFGKPLDDLVLPVVSFEGNSKIFNLGDLEIPLVLRPIALDANFNNPYQRASNNEIGIYDDEIEALARSVSSAYGAKHQRVNDAFVKRSQLADFIDTNFNRTIVDNNLPVNPNHDPLAPDPDTDAVTGKLIYPDTNFGNRLKAAISLAINNPDTFFINLGSGGLGGWDDHSDALGNYANRMQNLMAALRCAVKHMKWTASNNIVINVFGDFGRNVNLNNAGGWDHGNNQNFYTVGGWALDNPEQGRKLGKIVGVTERIGTPFQNRQFTSPVNGSYQCEPFAIASTIYKYFGVQNPELLTGEAAIDEVGTANERI